MNDNEVSMMRISSIILSCLLMMVSNLSAQISVTTEIPVNLSDDSGLSDESQEMIALGDQYYDSDMLEKAADCYKAAANQGNAEGQFKYGFALYYGLGTEIDFSSAAMWFRYAALQNYPKAYYNLAYCYMYGKGMPVNYEKSLQYLRTAAEMGCKEAQVTLAECYAKGVLVEKDEEESNKWDSLAKGLPYRAKKKEVEHDVSTTSSNPSSTENSTPSVSQHVVLSKEDILSGKTTASVESVAPDVNILFPIDNYPFHTHSIKVKYQLIAKGLENETELVVMVDNVRQSQDRAVRAANTIEVDLPAHDCTVSLYAKNKNGCSEPKYIRLIRETEPSVLPRLFVVAIGVSEYNDPLLPSLKYTCKDAKDFSQAMESKKSFPYCEVQIKTLCDKMATRDEIFEAMEWLKQEATSTDVCMFFYAGHGFRDEKDRFYFIPYGGTTEKLYNCFSGADFRREAEDIDSKFIVLVDACFSGALGSTDRSVSNHFAEQLRRTRNGMMLYASSAADTKSKEDQNWGNGAFTKILLEALNGAARKDGDEGLSTQQLDLYLSEGVRKLTNGKQRPILFNLSGVEHFNLFTYEHD